jgi:hypothetical protein
MEVMMLLLDQRGGDVKITDKVVQAAAGNSGSGREVMMLLLDRRGDDFGITSDLAKTTLVNSESSEEVLILLLKKARRRLDTKRTFQMMTILV